MEAGIRGARDALWLERRSQTPGCVFFFLVITILITCTVPRTTATGARDEMCLEARAPGTNKFIFFTLGGGEYFI